MFYPHLSGDRYINPLTDFGFKRLFGTEPNKNLLIDFLNVILPPQHRVKDQDCKVFYEKLKFIYLELPKFKKTIDQLNDHFDKWLFLLKHLPELEEPPLPLQENVFMQLFEVARITNFSQAEREAYENSLKYYRDMNGVIETAREEGIAQGMQEGKRSLLLKLLSQKLGAIPNEIKVLLHQLTPEILDVLSEALFDLESLEDLHSWLENINE
jgi:hypothetical protein